MKPSFEQINKHPGESQLKQLILDLPWFEPYWHFHQDYELTYIIKGSGKRIVGDSVEPFFAGDLVLLGPDLPHTWNSDPGEKGPCKAIVFQFGRNLIPDPANGFPEFRDITRLLDLAGRGLNFSGKEVNAMHKKIIRLTKLTELEKLSGFWMVLNHLSKVQQYTLLVSQGYSPSLSEYNRERINKVFRYVSQHYTENIKLSDISQLVHMTETSFSRFFKSLTGEVFTSYLSTIRISHSCTLLAGQEGKSIQQIALESGFKSSTHFNRMFQLKKGCSPSCFRKQYAVNPS